MPDAKLPESPRLRLRDFTAGDLDLLDRLNGDPEVMRYMGGPMSRADSRTMLEQRILGYAGRAQGLGAWWALERDGGAPIGFYVLNHIQGEPDIQVGYRLFQPFWGRGYATEMTIALLHYGFAQLRLPRIVAIADLPNLASHRVLEKSGLQRNGTRSFPHPAYARAGALAWFERDAGPWLAEFATGKRKP